ncbi:sensor histidine kinase [Gracilibacillus timonensis]|uniref:sensor histidine kinase n=1 Tax=Gracilibacillus timonensis TaxID=1816696 RepID=UPI00082561E0|nr:sensor histidine kinase [Gracilibacillus timonensis]
MKKWFHRSLKNQLTVFILVVVLIPVGLLGLFSYFMTVQVSKERAVVSGQGSINQLEDTMTFIIDDIENISVFLIGHQAVQDYLSHEGDLYAERREISGFLSNLAFSKRYIENIVITPINNNERIATSITTTEPELDKEDMAEGNWWSVKERNDTLDGKRDMITLIRPVRSTHNFRLLGYLTISLSQEVLAEYLNSIDLEWNGSVLIMNEEKVLAANKQEATADLDVRTLSEQVQKWTNKDSFIYESAKQKATVFTRNLPEVNWSLVQVIPFQEYSSQNRYVLWLTIYAVILAVILITSLVIFFIAKVFKPLTSLKDSIQKSTPGEKMKAVISNEDNEIGDLITSYNDLNARIAMLMDEVRKNESLKRTVDMQALQSQINPHFLYNTLASVHWIALSTKSNDIAKVVSHLSSFLRFSLNKGNEYCTVEQEVGNLVHYLEILKIRYPNSFQLHLDIPEEVKQYAMLKLVLQPLIENSITHGFFSVDDYDGNIELAIRKEGSNLFFVVRDNGTGISTESLDQIKQQFKEDQETEVVVGKNYGLRNVNLRLILHYGIRSGLQIDSKQQGGTVVYFSIPIQGVRE